MMIFMSVMQKQASVQQIQIEKIQDCQHYFMKQDQSLISIQGKHLFCGNYFKAFFRYFSK